MTAFRAVALVELDRFDEALLLAEAARATSPADDLLAQITWRQAIASAYVRTGRWTEAEPFALEGVDLARPTEAPVLPRRVAARTCRSEGRGRRSRSRGIARRGGARAPAGEGQCGAHPAVGLAPAARRDGSRGSSRHGACSPGPQQFGGQPGRHHLPARRLPKPLTTGIVVAVSITIAASAMIRLVEIIARCICFTPFRAFAAARVEGGPNGSVTGRQRAAHEHAALDNG